MAIDDEELDKYNLMSLLQAVSVGNAVRGARWVLRKLWVACDKVSEFSEIEPRAKKSK